MRVEPAILTVKEGLTTQFTCTATGEPAPDSVEWHFGSEAGDLPDGVSADSGVLTVGAATAEHEGEYYCVADNGEEQASEKAILYVSQGLR